MSEETAQPNIPQKWNIEQVKDNEVVFDCPECKEHYEFDAEIFTDSPTEQIGGLTKTDQFVSRNVGQQFLALLVALIVYYYSHRWINGPDVPLNQGIFIPIFIAVVAHTISKPLFSAGLFSGKGIPIYIYQCPQCQSEIFISSNGKKLALPSSPPENKDEE